MRTKGFARALQWLLILWIAVTRSVLSVQIPMLTQGLDDYTFSPLKHLPGISPYFDAIGSGLAHGVPPHCEVTAASYLIRHAAIYANDDDYEKYLEPFLKKVAKYHTGWSGPLTFLTKWKSPIDDPDKQLEQITPQGKIESKEVGQRLLARYPRLTKTVKRIYADGKSRTYDTAQSLVKSFSQEVEVIRITSDKNGAMDSQIPHKSCPAFSKEPGDRQFATFVSHYTPPIIERLNPFAPFPLSQEDIVGMQMLCGYESSIHGKTSPMCEKVFLDVEWLSLEYALDMKYAHMVGHFNPLSPYLGFPWLNTTISLFESLDEASADNNSQRFHLAVTHREVPPFVVTALGLFNSSSAEVEEFPTDQINWSRAWKMSEMIPFLGHVGLEHMKCKTSFGRDTIDYIRVIANSAPRPIPQCELGPGGGCLASDFKRLLDRGLAKYGDFHSVCGPSPK